MSAYRPGDFARQALRAALSDHCVAAEKTVKRMGLDKITRITLIARDPDNDEMSVVVTNDDLGDVGRVLAMLAERETIQG